MKHSVLAVAFSLWLSVSSVAGRTILVDDEGPADFNNIQAAATFDPGPMASGTTYYWRIDEVGA
jgi:hypothetical protein